MTVTQATLVNRVRDILGDTPWMQGAASVATNNGTSITVSDSTRWQEGAIMEFQNNGEMVWVQSVSDATTVVALRAVRGTTAAIQASGVVFKNPVYGYQNIINACNQTIQSLPVGQIYRKVSLASGLTYSGTKYWYDLTNSTELATGLLDATHLGSPYALISVTQVGTGTVPYVRRYGEKGTGYSVAFERNLPTSLATSGNAVAFPGGWYNTTNVINVDYAAKLTTTQTVAGTYDDFSDGLDVDVITYGAASRLVRNYDVNRVSDEDTNMGDSSVQPGMRTAVGKELAQEFNRYKTLKMEELRRSMPLMGTSHHSTRGGMYVTNGQYNNWGSYNP